MGRKIIIPIVLILLAIAFIYLFIPSTIHLSAVTHIKCTGNELNKCLHDESKWHQWFPGNKQTHEFNGFKYEQKEQKLNGADIDITNEQNKLHSSLVGLSLAPDSIMTTWSAEIKNDLNPISRIKNFMQASSLEKDMTTILDSLGSFASKTINVYGFNIKRTGFEDSLLLSTRKSYKAKPDLNEQYRVIHDLRDYIISKGGSIIVSPMVNIRPDTIGYKMQIAISVNKPLPENDKYSLIRMVHINGKYVTADVIGGPENIQKGHEQIEAYMKEHFLTTPGISFEIYLTDRIKETDPSKWITRIYYPST